MVSLPSSSLDSVGLMAKNVELCKLGYHAMRGKINKTREIKNKNLKL